MKLTIEEQEAKLASRLSYVRRKVDKEVKELVRTRLHIATEDIRNIHEKYKIHCL